MALGASIGLARGAGRPTDAALRGLRFVIGCRLGGVVRDAWRRLGSTCRAGHLDRGSDLCYDRWGCETGPLFYGGSPVPHRFTGCSSVRLERTVRDREVGSSNLPTPTILPLFLLRRAIFPKIGPSPT